MAIRIVAPFLLVLISLCANLKAQTLFYNKNEYDEALKLFKDQLASYDNYIRKQNLFLDSTINIEANRYSDCEIWHKLYSSYFKKKVVFLDNPVIRFRPAAVPLKIEYISFVKDSLTKKTIISCGDTNETNAFCYVTYYRFEHPGKEPLLIPNLMKKLNPDFNKESRAENNLLPFKYNEKLDFYKDKMWDGFGRPKYIYIQTTLSESIFITETVYKRHVAAGKMLIINDENLTENKK